MHSLSRCPRRTVPVGAIPNAPQIDKEFDRILRGGVFHPAPISPAPRPPTRPRRTPPRQSPRGDPRRNLGGRPATGNGLDGASGDGDGHGRNPGKRRGILEAGGSLFASPESTRGGDTRGFLGGGGKKRRGRPPGGAGRRTGTMRRPAPPELSCVFVVSGNGALRGRRDGVLASSTYLENEAASTALKHSHTRPVCLRLRVDQIDRSWNPCSFAVTRRR